MARVSRKRLKQPNITLKYNVGIYARLSIEDNITGGDSIENQINMLKSYIEKNEQLSYEKTYIDNGYSGTNFDREAFNALIKDVKEGIINTVVVKDLSRFGRNYIESGHYIEKIFPNIGVRFIAVNDNFDSENIKDNQDLEIALKSIINDSYAKDISKKIYTSLDAKKKSGKFLGKYAPYGYKKSAQNKYILEVNEETKDVVTMIFYLRLKGLGVTAIAHKLNNLNIPSQYRYLWEKGLRGNKDIEEKALWRGSSVKSLLENPNYIGAMVVRKYDTALYKGRQHDKQKLEHLHIIESTHEPIISKEVFYKVQNMSKGDIRKKSNRDGDNLLKGMVICGTCGGRLQRDSGYRKVGAQEKSYNFYCPKKYIKDGECSFPGIQENKLVDIIYKNIQLQIAILLDQKKHLEAYIGSPHYKREFGDMETKRAKLISEKNKIKMLRGDIYKDYKSGILSVSGYEFAIKKYEKDYNLLSKQIKELEAQRNSLDQIISDTTINRSISFGDKTELTREMILYLIEGIRISENKVIIEYKFKDEYKAFLEV
ncbi:recombinase family protein [Wukongibacter sp. M2B1]|uniref:recombinase family protein n=1 Tax=Wukongibacter sp. M2B1 TaxID=3088895 RepID=UPI003D7AE7A9